MAKRSARTRKIGNRMDYYAKSKEARAEALKVADFYKEKPLRFIIDNVIKMDIEVTKSDIKTIVSKNSNDDEFNFIKNKEAKDIRGFIKKAKYEGWSKIKDGKHIESAYFVYYSKKKKRKMILCIRKIIKTGRYKPYAIVDNETFKHDVSTIKKGTPE